MAKIKKTESEVIAKPKPEVTVTVKSGNNKIILVIAAVLIFLCLCIGGIVAIFLVLSQQGSITINPTPVVIPGNGKSEFSLTGLCYTGVASEQVTTCNLVDNTSGKTLAVFTPEDNGSDIYIKPYTMIVLGGSTADSQYIIADGGEGGDAWIEVYKLDLNTKKVSKIADEAFSPIGLNTALYKAVKPGCTDDTDPSCQIELARKETKACFDPESDAAYTSACFTNWSSLSTDSQTAVLSDLADIKDDTETFAKTYNTYDVIYWAWIVTQRDTTKTCGTEDKPTDCNYDLKVKNTADCKDPKKISAYSVDCFTNVSDLTSDLKDNLTNSLETINKDFTNYGLIFAF